MTVAFAQTRKADRETMAARLADVARAAGATVTVEPERDRLIYVNVTAPGGLSATVDFDGDYPETWCVPWFLPAAIGATLASSFAPGRVNPYHRRKATLFAADFDGLLALVVKGVRMAVDGSAYEVRT